MDSTSANRNYRPVRPKKEIDDQDVSGYEDHDNDDQYNDGYENIDNESGKRSNKRGENYDVGRSK